MKIVTAILFGMILLCGNALAATQYSYTGSAFSFFNPNDNNNVFWPAGFVSGTFTVNAPLPGNLTGQDISGDLASYSFSANGGSVLTEANSLVVAFDITTDAPGNITGWLIWISSPVTSPGDLVNVIELRNPDGDIVYEDAECAIVSQGACVGVNSNTGSRASSGVATGNFRQVAPAAPASVPAISLWGLGLLSLLLGAMGWARSR